MSDVALPHDWELSVLQAVTYSHDPRTRSYVQCPKVHALLFHAAVNRSGKFKCSGGSEGQKHFKTNSNARQAELGGH